MLYCPSCGVELNSEECPLCSWKLPRQIKEKGEVKKESPAPVNKQLSSSGKQEILEVSCWFFILLSTGISITADYISNGHLSWSTYPISPLVHMGLITSVGIHYQGKFKATGIFLLSLSGVFFLTWLAEALNYFLMIFLPVFTTGFFLSLGIRSIYKRTRRRGINIAAFIILAVEIVCIVTEAGITLLTGVPYKPIWSVITTVTLSPIVIFLFYLHYYVIKEGDLKKIFHL